MFHACDAPHVRQSGHFDVRIDASSLNLRWKLDTIEVQPLEEHEEATLSDNASDLVHGHCLLVALFETAIEHRSEIGGMSAEERTGYFVLGPVVADLNSNIGAGAQRDHASISSVSQ